MLPSELQYLRRENIDEGKWDRCIAAAPNGLIYAYSYYLDHAADNWSALIRGDYEQVMPLTWKRKWGIQYVCTPPFVQRLGVFGNNVSENDRSQFYSEVTKHFRYIDTDMDAPASHETWRSHRRTNFILSLRQPYNKMRENYSVECRRNIRKAIQRDCRVGENIPPVEVINLYRKQYGDKASYTRTDYERLLKLSEHAQKLNQLEVYTVRGKDHELFFGAFIFRCDRRLYYLLGAPTPAGRTARATYFLIDKLLQLNAGKPMLFDFEGSDIPQVAAFYSRFGSETETFYHIHYNRLPPIVRWLKR